jgi:adenine-specific DNA-methyltransferase
MNHLTIRKALNKAFLKVKPNRAEIDQFKQELNLLLTQVNPKEHEEFNKNILSDFLKNTFYAPNHFINTKGRNDLVMHHDKSATSKVGVIIEAKRPDNTSEMPTEKRPDRFSKPVRSGNVEFDLNCKAVQELVLYYLRERITDKNDKIKPRSGHQRLRSGDSIGGSRVTLR